ncbi:hypothetical protein WJX81_001540 [Elliptochloris bilobata]|uniref:Histone deacetylase interacting domain-containing protein n=1 Tax=Elliptochloris bilobata TaxID=381761 RepID=A0AAW1RUV8_9CHLO
MKRGHPDPNGCGPAKRPASGPAPNQAGARLTTNDALSYLRDVKVRFQDNKETYDTFLEIMKEFKAQRINTEGVIERVKSLFRGNRELILGFNTFLPKGYEIQMPLEEEKEPKQAVEFDQAINYVNKIKTRFHTDERVYKAFLEILNMYRKGQKTISNVYEEVALLFRAHRDLLEEFTYFLPDSSPPQQPQQVLMGPRVRGAGGRGKPGGRMNTGAVLDAGHARSFHKRKSMRKGDGRYDDDDSSSILATQLNFFERVKQRVRSREAYQDFLKCLNLYAQEIIPRAELQMLVGDILAKQGHSDLQVQFGSFLDRCEHYDMDFDPKMLSQKGHGRNESHKSKGEKYATRPISELDVSTWERQGTSYVKLPSTYPVLRCTGRDRLCNEQLNDVWVSVTSGSEDYSFKHMRKNQYEENLFRCEDDHYELDMAIETNASAIRAMQPLCDQALELEADEKVNWRLPPGKLSPIHFRAVQRIYGAAHGEQGAQVVDLLKKNPAVAVPVVLARLKQKDEEWRKVKQMMYKLWAKVYEANYHKSLDHRSFYFKQTDKKSLGAKAMVAEIKEAAEKQKSSVEEKSILAVSVSAPFASRLVPHLTFAYRDRELHNEVFKMIKYAVEEMISAGDQASRLLEFWTAIVERLFGLPLRDPQAMVPSMVKHGGDAEGLRVAQRKVPALRMPTTSAEADADGGADSEAEPPSGLEGDAEMDEADTAAGAASALVNGVTAAAVAADDAEAAAKPEAMDMDAAAAAGGAAAVPGEVRRGKLNELLGVPTAGHEGTGGTEAEGAGGTDPAHPVVPTQVVVREVTPQRRPSLTAEAAAAARAEAAADSDDRDDEEATPGPQTAMSGGEDMDPSSEEPEPAGNERAYAACKPLAPAEAARGAGAGAAAGRVFYGNDQFYLFFRLHAHLYDRLRRGVECAAGKGRPGWRAADADGDLGATLGGLTPEAREVHVRFMRLVFELIDGSLDPGQYEDAVRALLGTNSYVLFTLDKLIMKVVKQMQLLLNDDLASKLAELYRYEAARDPAHFADAIYNANAHVLLHDDNCFRFEARGSRADGGDGALTVQLLDPDRTEVTAGVLLAPFAEYLRCFTDDPAGAVVIDRQGRRRRPFLRRSLPPDALGDEEAAMDAGAAALVGAELTNGLECKITCETSKVSYVLDTEDVFRRRKAAAVRSASAVQRAARFASWLETRHAASQIMGV